MHSFGDGDGISLLVPCEVDALTMPNARGCYARAFHAGEWAYGGCGVSPSDDDDAADDDDDR